MYFIYGNKCRAKRLLQLALCVNQRRIDNKRRAVLIIFFFASEGRKIVFFCISSLFTAFCRLPARFFAIFRGFLRDFCDFRTFSEAIRAGFSFGASKIIQLAPLPDLERLVIIDD